AEVNGVCLASAPFAPTPVTKAECEAMISTHGIQACNYDTDYWAGAVKACGGTSKMASMAQLGNIAAYVYNQSSIGAKDDVGIDYDGTEITFDSTKAAELGLPSSAGFCLWSGEERDSNLAYSRTFASDYTEWDSNYGYRYTSPLLAVCLGD
ncbi:hypothetical protein IJZ97_01835, partial [bacterium]|nr:hypothetical protein [bacterium]